MYLNIGSEELLKKNIIGIFDLDTSTVSKKTRDFINKAQKDGKIITLSNELPKSFILEAEKGKEEKVYISQFSAATLLGRSEDLF
ncbi:MAG: DUF370 domain-containing protein [Oscillospiraceae bacterium]|nr:DUF370 domain-containing protein [Oscillospiraceae bacterium]